MSGQSGKGNSSAETTQQVKNQNVAAQSGIAFGADSSNNKVSITSSDPETTKYAIAGGVQDTAIAAGAIADVAGTALGANAQVTGAAFNFAGHAADVAAQTNEFATKAVEDIAGGSILAQNDLATKFGKNTSDLAAQNVSLLQSVGQELTTVSLKALDNNHDNSQLAFGVAAQAAPQTDNYTATALAETSSKTYLYIALAAVAGLLLFFLGKKRSA